MPTKKHVYAKDLQIMREKLCLTREDSKWCQVLYIGTEIHENRIVGLDCLVKAGPYE